MKVENEERSVENGELRTESWKSFSFQLSPYSCVIQLELGTYDYCLSEIARIVEENDAKILGLTVDDIPGDPSRMMVTLLINQPECAAIVKSFHRYNYNVVNTYSSPDENYDMLDRFSLLMRYMNI